MQFESGKPRHPKAGRQKGTPNKSTQTLFDTCEKHGVNVFEGMLICAKEATTNEEKFGYLKELAPYLYPKRKSVDVTASEFHGVEVVIKDYTTKT